MVTLKTYDRNYIRKKKNKVEKQKKIHKNEKKLHLTYMYKVCVYHIRLQIQNYTVCDQHETLNRSNILRKDGEIHKSYTSNNYIHQIFTNLNLFCVRHEFNSDAITKIEIVSQIMTRIILFTQRRGSDCMQYWVKRQIRSQYWAV